MNSALKYGAILGVVGVVISVILYAMGPETMVGSLSYGSLVVSIGLFVYFGIQMRKENGGYFTFGEAFKNLFVMGMVAGAINVVFGALLYNVIDPGLADQMKEIMTDKMLSMYESLGLDQNVIDEAMSKLDEQDFGMTAKNAAIAFFGYYGIGGAIGSAIVGAIIKKKKPEELGF